MAPRYAFEGSKGGTVKYDSAVWIDRALLADRLYSSIDELLLGIPSSLNSERTAQSNLDADSLQGAKFFLTSSNRAPELNLYGKPRVSIWPIDSTYTDKASQRVSVTDRLLSFCSTAGGKPFFFTRRDSKSSFNDIEQSNNRRLLDYLDTLCGLGVPGYSGSFKDKYSAWGSRQILTEIYDYIRITNPQDSLLPGYIAGSLGFGGDNQNWFAPKLTSSYELGRAQICPSVHTDWNTQGFGRIARPFEISIQFIGLGEGLPALSGTPVPIPDQQIDNPTVAHESTITKVPGTGWVPPNKERAIQAVLLINMLSPANALIQSSYFQWIEIKGLGSWTINGKNLGLPDRGVFLFGANNQAIGTDKGGSYQPCYLGTAGDGGRIFSKAGTNAKRQYPFYGTILTVPVSGAGSTMDFSGGSITINLYDVASSPNLQIEGPGISTLSGNRRFQTLTVNFPRAAQLPVPGLTRYPLVGTATTSSDPITSDAFGRVNNRDRFKISTNSDQPGWAGAALIDEFGIDINGDGKSDGSDGGGDVVQSMVLSGDWSDARLLALNEVPSSAFDKHPKYGSARLAHDIFYNNGAAFSGNSGIFGTLVNGAAYTAHPPVPPTLTEAADWDNGVSISPDGPWINAPDSGNMRPPGQAANTKYIPYFTEGGGFSVVGNAFFSPNRQVSSPGMFGSLSTGLNPSSPSSWRTLLFHPPQNPAHAGASSPPDYLMMDLFWMPVAEPYAISEPFSTAGKVNLNQQLIPFTYINRTTGIRAAMEGEKIAIMAKSNAPAYKSSLNSKLTPAVPSHHAFLLIAMKP